MSALAKPNGRAVPAAGLTGFETVILDLALAVGAFEHVAIENLRGEQLRELAQAVGEHVLRGLDAAGEVARARSVPTGRPSRW